jgi:hypothetical protein
MTSNDGVTPSAEGNDPVAQANAAIGQMSQGEKLIGLGALVLVGIDLLADIILDEYAMSRVLWLVAVLALMALWVRRMRGGDLPVRYEWVVVFLGYAGGIVGLREFLGDLENGLFDARGGYVFFALATYIAAGVMAFGAYTSSKS